MTEIFLDIWKSLESSTRRGIIGETILVLVLIVIMAVITFKLDPVLNEEETEEKKINEEEEEKL